MNAIAVACRQVRTAGITARGEFLAPGRMLAVAVRMGVKLLLVTCLWRALYAHTAVSAGLSRSQAVSYAVLAVLVMRIRETDRWISRDSVIQHMEHGTIIYWFLRPVPASRYHLFRALGDQLYGWAWAGAGYGFCLLAGAVRPPASGRAAAAFAVTFLLGQGILYYLALLTDQVCFWTIKNSAAVDLMAFVQNLLSGAYAALWFFPGWFQAMSSLLPFQATLDIPLSFYIGRLPVADLSGQVVVQVSWLAGLVLLTRFLWVSAGERVVAQGG